MLIMLQCENQRPFVRQQNDGEEKLVKMAIRDDGGIIDGGE